MSSYKAIVVISRNFRSFFLLTVTESVQEELVPSFFRVFRHYEISNHFVKLTILKIFHLEEYVFS